jgi:hypothetical protein
MANRRLSYSKPFKVYPNEYEQLYDDAFKVVKDSAEELINRAANELKIGKSAEADCTFSQVNYFYSLIHYAAIISKFVARLEAVESENLTKDYIKNKYAIDCVQDSLSCLSCGDSLLKAMTDIFRIFGLGWLLGDTDEEVDCPGIGGMVINLDGNDNQAFIIGNHCVLDEDPVPPPYGDMFLGDWKRDDFFEVFE